MLRCRYAGSLETSYDNEELQPDWEIDPSTLEIGAKVGQGEFGAVHKASGDGVHAAGQYFTLSCAQGRFITAARAAVQAAAQHKRDWIRYGTSLGNWMQARWHGATVAVKILRQADEAGLGDFRTELNVLQKVQPSFC